MIVFRMSRSQQNTKKSLESDAKTNPWNKTTKSFLPIVRVDLAFGIVNHRSSSRMVRTPSAISSQLSCSHKAKWLVLMTQIHLRLPLSGYGCPHNRRLLTKGFSGTRPPSCEHPQQNASKWSAPSQWLGPLFPWR
jgi:hypothetical protein